MLTIFLFIILLPNNLWSLRVVCPGDSLCWVLKMKSISSHSLKFRWRNASKMTIAADTDTFNESILPHRYFNQ